MTDAHENPDQPRDPLQGQVRHSMLSARIPERVGSGALSNGATVLAGHYEFFIDFLQRIIEPQRLVARVVLSPPVMNQFITALQENLQHYESNWGPIHLPRPQQADRSPEAAAQPDGDDSTTAEDSDLSKISAAVGAATAGPGIVSDSESDQPPAEPGAPVQGVPNIEDLYNELRMADDELAGHYANAVLIRHSPVEFCFDFVNNAFPRPVVAARVFMAAPHVPPLLSSLQRSRDTRGQSDG